MGKTIGNGDRGENQSTLEDREWSHVSDKPRHFWYFGSFFVEFVDLSFYMLISFIEFDAFIQSSNHSQY